MKLLKNLKSRIAVVLAAVLLVAPFAVAETKNCMALGWRGLVVAFTECIISIDCEESEMPSAGDTLRMITIADYYTECEVCREVCLAVGIVAFREYCTTFCRTELRGTWVN